MARRGYYAELLAKKELEKSYGPQNVIKMSIGQSCDFLVLSPNEDKIEKIVEVKSTSKNKYYPRTNEKNQLKMIDMMSKEHKIAVEVWIKFKNKGVFNVFSLKDIGVV